MMDTSATTTELPFFCMIYSPGGCIAFEDRLFSIITMHKQKRNFFLALYPSKRT